MVIHFSECFRLLRWVTGHQGLSGGQRDAIRALILSRSREQKVEDRRQRQRKSLPEQKRGKAKTVESIQLLRASHKMG